MGSRSTFLILGLSNQVGNKTMNLFMCMSVSDTEKLKLAIVLGISVNQLMNEVSSYIFHNILNHK